MSVLNKLYTCMFNNNYECVFDFLIDIQVTYTQLYTHHVYILKNMIIFLCDVISFSFSSFSSSNSELIIRKKNLNKNKFYTYFGQLRTTNIKKKIKKDEKIYSSRIVYFLSFI